MQLFSLKKTWKFDYGSIEFVFHSKGAVTASPTILIDASGEGESLSVTITVADCGRYRAAEGGGGREALGWVREPLASEVAFPGADCGG